MEEKVTQSFQLTKENYERLNNYLEDAGFKKSAFFRDTVINKIAETEIKDIDEKVAEIEKDANEKSFDLLKDDFPTEEKENGELRFLSEEDFQTRINVKREKLENLNKKIKSLEDKRADLLLEKALEDGDVEDEDLTDVRKEINEKELEKDDLKELIKELRKAKDRVREIEKERKRLGAKIAAERIKDELLEPALQVVNKRYKQFKQAWEKWDKIHSRCGSKVHSAGGSNVRKNFYDFEQKLSQDFGIDCGGPELRTKNYQLDGPLSEALPTPRIPDDTGD